MIKINNMLGKDYRITQKKEFSRIITGGKVGYGSFLMIKFIKNDLAHSRFGIIVSNKVSKKAPQRNLIRRRIREVIRLNLSRIKKGVDVVIIVSPKIINSRGKSVLYKEIELTLLNLLSKNKLL